MAAAVTVPPMPDTWRSKPNGAHTKLQSLQSTSVTGTIITVHNDLVLFVTEVTTLPVTPTVASNYWLARNHEFERMCDEVVMA